MIDVKMKPGFPMRDLELRRCIEGVICPHAPLREFFKRKRSRMESAGFIFHFNYYTTFSYLQKGHFYIQSHL